MTNSTGKILAVMATIWLAFSGGCKEETFSIVFNHGFHVVENELECSTCHQPAANGSMTQPSHDVCSGCHPIDMDSPSDDCLKCHRASNAEEIEVVYPKRPEEDKIIFSHESHEARGATCKSCHSGVDTSVSAEENILPTKASCLSCHDDEKASQKDCSLCHAQENSINGSHRRDWELRHGVESHIPNSRCMVCHEDNYCIECHHDTKPRDHNNTWRKISHGAEAAWNRSRCAVCHQEDFCDRCHQNSRPRSHTAGWASGPITHCYQCHYPAGTAKCSICHGKANHPTAPDSPHPPTEGFICEECHPTPAGIFAPHPNPGFDCTLCHKR